MGAGASALGDEGPITRRRRLDLTQIWGEVEEWGLPFSIVGSSLFCTEIVRGAPELLEKLFAFFCGRGRILSGALGGAPYLHRIGIQVLVVRVQEAERNKLDAFGLR